MFRKLNSRSIAKYKEYLVEHYRTQTVNLRLIGLSKYLKFLKKEKLRPKLIKYKNENFLQNVISYEDYEFLKESLKKEGQMKWFFIVSYLGATGVRVSEVVQLKIFHIKDGYADIYSKGGKLRRVYIPKKLQEETLDWLSGLGRDEDELFLNKNGGPLGFHQDLNTSQGVIKSMKKQSIPILSGICSRKYFWKKAGTLHSLPTF